MRPIGQPDELERIGDTLLDLVLRPLLPLEPEGDVPRDVEMAEERVALEHHVHVPLVRRHVLDRLALEQDAPLGGHLEAREHAKRRRLAAPRRPEQAEELALRDRQVDAVDRREVAEPLRHTLDRDRVRHAYPLSCPVSTLMPLSLRPKNLGIRTAATTAVIETTIISVPIALIVGETPKRIADQMRTGSG